MTTADKLSAIAENTPRLYERGKQDERTEFWGHLQKNGTRTDYQYAFYTSQWNDNTFRPQFDLRPTNANNMFSSSGLTDLTGALARGGVVLDTSRATTLKQTLYWCRSLKAAPVIDATAVTDKAEGLYATFGGDIQLESIEKIILPTSGELKFSLTFMGCSALEEIRFEGVIGQNISFVDSTRLSHDSLMSILAALADRTGDSATYTCTLGAANLSKLTAAERALATDKGWTLA